MNPQKLSIRDLVASPDLEFHSLANPERSHAAAQAALGRKYKSFKSEVALTVVLELDNSRFEIHGRMDGIRRVKDGYCIYEIKPVPGNPRQWRHHSKLLRARWQLMLYCDLFQTAPSPHRGKLQKAILLLAGDDGKVCEESIDINTAAGALEKRLRAIQKKQEARRSRQCAHESIDRFFEADKQSDRPLQVSAESKINSDPMPDRLLLTLPPGAGKTRLALRFALRAARRLRLPVYWITAKAAGRHAVQEEIERLQALGLKLSFCWKTTADRLCNCDSPGEDCPIRIKTQTALFFGELTASELAEPSACWCPHQIQQYLQTQSHIVIADINYLLNASSLSQYPAVLIIDEVQHFVNRLLDHSRVVIPLRRLKKLMQRLPASRRLKFSELLNPEWLDDELLSSNPSLWNELAVLLRQCAVEDDLSYTIQRLAALLAKDPDNYSLTWYSSGLESGWIGMIAEPESFVCESLRQYPVVAALSGSLPEDSDTLRALLPGFAEFQRISPVRESSQPVAIVPELDFRFPVSISDITKAVFLLVELHREFKSVIAVFTQNRESSVILSDALRVRGFVPVIDSDIDPAWKIVADLNPDFVLIPLGSSLSESVNPPVGLFSCTAVLAPGHTPRDKLREHCANPADSASFYRQSFRESVSRIIQAVGRVHRSLVNKTPVFLLNQAFVNPEFLRLWPRSWSGEMKDIIFDSVTEALAYIRSRLSETASTK